MRYRFGPSTGRVTPAFPVQSPQPGDPQEAPPETLLGLNLIGIGNEDRIERVTLQVAPPTGPPPHTRPTRAFVLYVSEPPREGVTPEQFLSVSSYNGASAVPDPGSDGVESPFVVSVETPLGAAFTVVTVIEYPGED